LQAIRYIVKENYFEEREFELLSEEEEIEWYETYFHFYL